MTTFTLQDLNIHPTVEDVLNHITLPQVPEPQPTSETGTNVPTLESVLQSIAEQFSLLATVINQTKAQPNTTPPEGNPPSLQETVGLVLQQANWFKDMVADEVDKMDFEDLVTESVKVCVESEVEHYFSHSFSPEDHFDFGDAVADRVDDMLDDIVRDRVMDSLEEVVAEKLSEASVSISF